MATAMAQPYSHSSDSRKCVNGGGDGGGGVYYNHRRQPKSPVVCKYWLAGRCNRKPCRFSHQSLPAINQHQTNTYIRGHGYEETINTKNFTKQSNVATAENSNKFKNSYHTARNSKQENHPCLNWMSGTCVQAQNCRFPHSWVDTRAMKDIERTAELKEHKMSVTGIVLPHGSNILYTGSKDGTLRAFNANSGNCIDSINVGAEVGCVLSEHSWVFVGVPNAILAWNIETSQRLSLEGSVGQVKAMLVHNDKLFVGCEDGKILTYKPCPEKMTFRLIATLKGHSKAVLSLSCSITQLYSGSEDCTIRCWNTQTYQCTHVLEGHSGAVSCLITWECLLLSGSLDKSIKVWAGTKDEGIEEIHTCYEECEVTAFMGMTDAMEKPVLFASTSDESVRMYELDIGNCLAERGRLFTRKRVVTISCSGRQVFTGDCCGDVCVWTWLGESQQPVDIEIEM